MSPVNDYRASYEGVTAGEGSNNISIYLPSLNANITPDVLTIENVPTSADTFDYSLTIQGGTGSAEAFSRSLLFAVDGDQTNARDIRDTDIRFIGKFNAIQASTFFTHFATLSSSSDLSSTYILAADSVLPSGKNTSVSLGREYVALIAKLYSGDALFSDVFNNSKTVREKIDGASSVSGSILNAIDTVFTSIAETNLSSYTELNTSPTTLLGANAALVTFKAMSTLAEDRLNNTNTDGTPALTQVLNNLPGNIGSNENVYQMPLLPGDIIQLGVSLNIPAGQFTITPPTVTPNSTVSITQKKVLVNFVLA